MKVLHVLYQSIPNTAGSSIRSRDILNSQLREGVRPIVITSPFQPPFVKDSIKEDLDGITYYRTYFGNHGEIVSENKTPFFTQILKIMRFFSFVISVYKIVKEEKPDIIHAHAMFFCAFAAKISSVILKVPMIYEVRSLWEERYKRRNFFTNLIFSIITFIETLAMYLSDELIVINQSLKNEISSRLLLKKKKIHIIENAINIEKIKVKKSGVKRLKVFAYVGSISPIEGLDLLVQAFINLHKLGFRNKLVFFGDGIYLRKLKLMARGDDLIVFKGSFSPDIAADIYSEIDIVVNPRKKTYLTDSVTPLKPLEAMAYEKIIMASNVGGMKELIKHNFNGILFDSDSVISIESAVQKILKRKDLEIIIKQAKDFIISNRSWVQNAKKYKLIYSNLYA
tara:strand:+ start:12620 stop:13807 length:1188 start_codon:yes stop_codon:yes gene_type:complete